MTSNITIFSNCLIICLWLGNVSYTPAKSIEVRIQWDRNAEYLYCIFLTFKTHAVFCFQCFSERQLTLEDINDIMEHFLFGSVESTDVPSPLLQTVFQSTDNPRLGQNGYCIVFCMHGNF